MPPVIIKLVADKIRSRVDLNPEMLINTLQVKKVDEVIPSVTN
tara:strand:+ start:154 stop:282 length:129 start_codon:yes stop_codon:yes gene_type:complete